MKLAITGGAGEGKSTVLGYIREIGIEVGSADVIARAVFDRPEVQERIAEWIGSGLPVSRTELRSLILQRPQMRHELNRIMHPPILAALEASPQPVIEVPLLIETCLQGRFDRIWVVTCGEEEQRRRLMARLGSAQEAERQMAAQLPTLVKCAFADRIIRTNSDPDTVRSYVIESIVRDLEVHLA